jgi:hypothetical protein
MPKIILNDVRGAYSAFKVISIEPGRASDSNIELALNSVGALWLRRTARGLKRSFLHISHNQAIQFISTFYPSFQKSA